MDHTTIISENLRFLAGADCLSDSRGDLGERFDFRNLRNLLVLKVVVDRLIDKTDLGQGIFGSKSSIGLERAAVVELKPNQAWSMEHGGSLLVSYRCTRLRPVILVQSNSVKIKGKACCVLMLHSLNACFGLHRNPLSSGK